MMICRRLIAISARRRLLLLQKSSRGRNVNVISLRAAAAADGTFQRSFSGSQRLTVKSPLVSERRLVSVSRDEEDERNLSRKENARRILELSVGAMNQADLDAAEVALFFLTEGERGNEDIQLSWRLLEKLVDIMKAKGPQQATSKPFLERAVDWIRGSTNGDMSPKHQEEWLNRVIKAWSFHRAASPHPRDVLAKIERYDPVVRPDTETYPMMIKAVGSKLSRSEAPALAESILNEIMEKGQSGIVDLPNIKAVNACIHVWTRSSLSEAPQKAEALLLWANEVAERTGSDELRPNTVTYNTVLDTWVKSKDEIAPERAEAILNRMLELYEGGMERVMPDVISFSTVINAWANSRQNDAGKHAEALLMRLNQLAESSGEEELRPTTVTFNSTMNAWAKSGDPAGPDRAEAILRQLEKQYREGMEPVKPNVVSYTVVINAYANSHHPQATERALALFDEMKASNDPTLAPDKFTYTAVLKALRKQNGKYVDRIKELRLEMDQSKNEQPLSTTKSPETEPKSSIARSELDSLHAIWKTYRNDDDYVQISVLAQLGGLKNIKRYGYNKFSEFILDHPDEFEVKRADDHYTLLAKSLQGVPALDDDELEHILENNDPVVRPDIETYPTMIKSVSSKLSRGERPALAESILHEIMKKGESDIACLPNICSVNACIHIWAQSRRPEAPQKAEALLLWTNEVAERTGSDELRPNTITYNTVLDTWAKSKDKNAPERAEAILNRMFELSDAGMERVLPDERSFNIVINAWAKSGRKDAPEKAEAFLNHMLKLFDEGNTRVKPNAASFSTVIDAWAKARRKDSGKQAEKWLERLYELCERTGDDEQRPNTIAFNATLDAWAKSGHPDAPNKAEALLNRMFELYERGMEHAKPNVRSFSTVIDAWAKSGRKDAGSHADVLVERLDQFAESSGGEVLQPNTVTLNSTMNAWARSGDPAGPARAEAILRHMEKLFQEGSKRAMPTAVSYTIVISAFAYSLDPEAAEKALALLDEVKRSNNPKLEPTKVTYTMVLKALEKQEDKYADRIKELRREMNSPNVRPR